MTDQSDWVRLAERLTGFPALPEGGQQSFYMEAQKLYLPSKAAEDALIGRALRVAFDTGNMGPSLTATLSRAAQGDPAVALELLDAVGYEHA